MIRIAVIADTHDRVPPGLLERLAVGRAVMDGRGVLQAQLVEHELGDGLALERIAVRGAQVAGEVRRAVGIRGEDVLRGDRVRMERVEAPVVHFADHGVERRVFRVLELHEVRVVLVSIALSPFAHGLETHPV